MRRSETRGKSSPDTTVATRRATDDLVSVLLRACASPRACASLVFANPPAHTRNQEQSTDGRRKARSVFLGRFLDFISSFFHF